MVQFNFSERTIKAKVVYYGPPQSGKTTNLEQIHGITDPEGANRLISLNTAQDRTLFFDLLPFSLGSVSGYDFKIQLYTVPGQVQYNATRRVVLAGADAVVFVADSRTSMARENLAAFENMKVNLLANRLVPEKLPLVLQYNKQDLPGLLSQQELEGSLNFWGRRAFPAVASRGEGVMETFVAVAQEMLAAIAQKYNLKEKGLDPELVPAVVADAFAKLRDKAAPSPPAAATPPRVAITQPEAAEPAYPGQSAPDASPVSEELLHRAIRSNVDLAETLGQLVREMGTGLGTIRTQADALASAIDEAARASALRAIRAETERLRGIVRGLGGPAQRPAASLPPQPSPTPPIAAEQPRPAPARVGAALATPPALPRIVRPAAAAHRALASEPASAPAPPAGPATTLDGLLAELAAGLGGPRALRGIEIESRIARGTPLPRCPADGLRRALGGMLDGLLAVVATASTLTVRAERKPVLLRARDGSDVRRDFLMLALTHADGVGPDLQQRVLEGRDPGAIGAAHRAVREMGGFLRFAPLPGGRLETRLFLPL